MKGKKGKGKGKGEEKGKEKKRGKWKESGEKLMEVKNNCSFQI